jgi:predicted MFS family arabinose efflux permease
MMPPSTIALVAWAALGIALNVGIARFTYGVMLPALQRDLSLAYFGGGALNAVHLLGYLAGTLAAPTIARRLGMPRLSRYAHALVALGALVCALAPNSAPAGPLLLALGRLGTGLGAGAGIVAILVLVLAAVPSAARSLASALVWSGMGFAVVLSGLAAGPLVEGTNGWRAAFVVSAVLAALLALVFPPRGLRPAGAEPAAAPSHGLRQFLRPRWLFLIGAYFMFGAGYIAWSTFAGARLAAVGAPLAAVRALWLAFGAAMIAGSAITFALLRIDRRRRFALVAALLAGALGALASWSDAPGAALAGALLVGLNVAATPTIVTTYARERCSAEDYAMAFSVATAALGIGQLLGPLAAGALADRLGVAAVALFAVAVYALGAVLSLLDGFTAQAARQSPRAPSR